MLSKRKLLKVLFCLFLGVSTMSGANVDPKQIEELLRTMNQVRIEFTVPDRDDTGDPK